MKTQNDAWHPVHEVDDGTYLHRRDRTQNDAWHPVQEVDVPSQTGQNTERRVTPGARGGRTFTDGIVVEVGFALVACDTIECRTTITLTSLLITGHSIGTRHVTVTSCNTRPLCVHYVSTVCPPHVHFVCPLCVHYTSTTCKLWSSPHEKRPLHF